MQAKFIVGEYVKVDGIATGHVDLMGHISDVCYNQQEHEYVYRVLIQKIDPYSIRVGERFIHKTGGITISDTVMITEEAQLLQKQFESAGYISWINSEIYPDNKIYTKEYTQWLEQQVLALRKSQNGVEYPTLEQCSDASKSYADIKAYNEYGLVYRAFQEGINWALNFISKAKNINS